MNKVLLFIFSLSLSYALNAEDKIAVMDYFKVFSEHPKAKERTLTLKKDYTQDQDVLEGMRRELDKLEVEIEAEQDELQKTRLKGELRRKNASFLAAHDSMESRYKTQNEKFSIELKKDIEKVVKRFSEINGYTMVLDTGRFNIVYIKESRDITENVLQILRDQQKAKGMLNPKKD